MVPLLLLVAARARRRLPFGFRPLPFYFYGHTPSAADPTRPEGLVHVAFFYVCKVIFYLSMQLSL